MEDKNKDYSELLNEVHWDTVLTMPFQLNKKVKMYHYSEKKIDGELKPVAINIGNKLARKPRCSVWWTRNPENFDFPLFNFIQCEVRYLEDGRRTFGNEVLLIVDDKIIPEVNYHKVFYVIHEPFYKKYKKKFDEMKSYRYEKTFKYKELGRGTENHTDEWTYDKPVKPDSVTVKTFKDLLKEKVVVIADGEEFEKYKSVAKVRNGKEHYQDWIGRKEDWFKYDEETYNKKREEYEKKHGIPSYKEIHNGKFNLAEDYSELFDDVLNERFEVLVTRPKDYFKKEITLYRGSKENLDIIKPNFLNDGSKLSPARASSFWTDDLYTSYWYTFNGVWLNELFPAKELEIPNDLSKNKYFNGKIGNRHAWFIGKINKNEPQKLLIYLGNKFSKEEMIERLKKFIFPEPRYIYKKIVKGSDPDLGIGHNDKVREFTLDREIVPDEKIEVTKFPDELYSNIIFISDPKELVNFFQNLKNPETVSKWEYLIKHHDKTIIVPKRAMKTEFFKKEFIEQVNAGKTDEIKLISDIHIGKDKTNLKEILKDAEEIGEKISKELKFRESTLILLGDIIDKSCINHFEDIFKTFRAKFPRGVHIFYLLGNSEDSLTPMKIMKKSEVAEYKGVIHWAGYTIETDKYVFSHAPMRVPEGKINIHGHLHQSRKYWNADPTKCVNISKVKGTGELVSFDEVLKYGPDKEGIELTQDPTGGKKNKVMFKLYKQYGLAEDFKEETMIENYFNENDFNIFRQELLESVLDPINKTRCKEIFDDNDNMKSDVKKFILDIVNGFKKEVDFNIRNVYMIGSSTGYQYTATSDIDIEVETDLPKEKLWNIIKLIPKGTLLPNTQKPINLFVLDKDSSYDFKNAENVYDVVSGKWLKDSGKEKVEIPYPYIKGLATYFMNGCDLAISEFNKDMKELQEYMDLDPETQEISQKEKVEAIDRKIVDLRKDIDSLKMAHHVIFGFEKEGYEGMPFKISIDSELNKREERYSVNNLVYKYIDKFGYLDKMNELMRTGRDKIKEVEKYLKGLKSEDKKQLEEDYTNLLLEAKFWTCQKHHANLDIGEKCDECEAERKKKEEDEALQREIAKPIEKTETEDRIKTDAGNWVDKKTGYEYKTSDGDELVKESLAIDAILSDTEDLNEANIKPTSLRWRLVLGCMKYVSEEAYYDAFPEDRELKPSRKERTRKLKEAMNNLSQEDKQKILDMQKAKALEAKAEKIGRGHKIAGAAVGATATIAGAVTGIAAGAHTISSIVNNSVNNAPAGAKVITGLFSSIVAIIAGIIAGAFPLIIGGIISATSNAIGARNAKVARNKYIIAANEDEIAELLEKDIKNNKDADLEEVITKNVNEDYSALFDNINKSKDYSNLFEDAEIDKIFGTSDFRYKINDVLLELYPIVYGFISIKDGSRIDDREFIHNCDHLSDIYRVNYDPTVTLKNKLGICTDQSLATQYLMNKYHPEIDCELYALTKGRFGHCVCTLKDLDKYYYLENAWDKKRGLHGPFASKEELEAYLDKCYHEAHDKDNNDPVFVRPYKEYIKENLNESVNWR